MIQRRRKNDTEKKKSGKEEKLDIVESYFRKKILDFVFIASEVNMTRQ